MGTTIEQLLVKATQKPTRFRLPAFSSNHFSKLARPEGRSSAHLERFFWGGEASAGLQQRLQECSNRSKAEPFRIC